MYVQKSGYFGKYDDCISLGCDESLFWYFLITWGLESATSDYEHMVALYACRWSKCIYVIDPDHKDLWESKWYRNGLWALTYTSLLMNCMQSVSPTNWQIMFVCTLLDIWGSYVVWLSPIIWTSTWKVIEACCTLWLYFIKCTKNHIRNVYFKSVCIDHAHSLAVKQR